MRIEVLLAALKRRARDFEIFLVCNRKDSPLSLSDFPYHSMTSEFLSDQELEELLSSLRSFGLFVSAVFSDTDFYDASLPNDRRRYVVFNLDPSSVGPSGKLLVAAVAQVRNVVMTGSRPSAP